MLDFQYGAFYKHSVAAPQGPFYKALGVRLGRARRAAKVTQAALAHAVGLSRTSITNIEKGRQPVQVHILVQLAEALGTSVSAFLPPVQNSAAIQVASHLQQVELQKLRRLDTEKRVWVEDMIRPANADTEDTDGSEVFASAKESNRTPQIRSRKKSTGAS